jgi:L-threonylcarbamoyladenylate synthase
VLEGGPCRTGIESTVIDLSSPRARILRPGLIGAGELAAVLGRPVEEPAGADDSGGPHPPAPLLSPGLLARHYAPTTPAQLFDPSELDALLRDPQLAGGAIVLAHDRLDVAPPHTIVPMPAHPDEYAHRLYAALREADAKRPALILIQHPPLANPRWSAILDRLTRATTP